MAWATPRDYVPGEVLTATKMQQISDDLNYLYTPNSLVLTVRGTGVNETTTSTTIVAINNAIFSGSVVCTGRGLSLSFDGDLRCSVANTSVSFDILIDGTNYVSSMTSTPATNNLWQFRVGAIGLGWHMSGNHYLPAGSLSVGSHSFALMWKVGAASTGTLELSGSVAQFRVRE